MRAVLTFHSVDNSGSILSYPTRAFARLVEWLAATGIPVVGFQELVQRDDGITITFDDGMRTVHGHALPVLRDHGFPAHVFLTTGHVGMDIGWRLRGYDTRFEMLSWDEIASCVEAGFRIESHTVTHPDLRGLPATAMIDECAKADDAITQRTGLRPSLFAFPFGLYDDTVRKALAPRYTACFTTRLGYFRRDHDLSQVPRLDTYYLRSPFWNQRLFSPLTQGYVGLRAAVRAARGSA